MRFNVDAISTIFKKLQEDGCEYRAEAVLEAAIYSHMPLDDLYDDVGYITRINNESKIDKNSLAIRLEKQFPEHIIYAKLIENKKRILILTTRNTMFIHDVNDFMDKTEFQCDYHATSICATVIGNDFISLKIIFGSVWGDLIEWVPRNGTQIRRRIGHEGMVFSIVSTAKRLFSISDDRTIRMWSIDNDNDGPICTTYGHTARPLAITVDPVNFKVYTGGIEQTLFIWDYEENSIVLKNKIYMACGVIRSISLIDEAQLLITAYSGQTIVVDLNEEPISVIQKNVINFARINDAICFITNDGKLKMYDDDSLQNCLFEIDDVKHMNSSESHIIAWNERQFYYIRDDFFTNLEMSFPIISAIGNDDQVIVKLLDGTIVRLCICNAEKVEVKAKFKLPNVAMIPKAFETIWIDNVEVTVIGTSHGDLLYVADGMNVAQFTFEGKDNRELFGKREISCLKRLETKANCLMSLGKNGKWNTMEYGINKDGNIFGRLLNSKSFASSSRMTCPCKFLRLHDGRLLIIGFHGTSFVVYDATNSNPMCEVWCGGGNREWTVTETFGNAIQFDFLIEGTIFRCNLSLDKLKYIARSAHKSAIVCTASCQTYLASVSLDGFLTITTGFCFKSFDYETILNTFVGENLLCCDLMDDGDCLIATTGGGKSKVAVFKIEKGSQDGALSFWQRSASRPDEGRIVCVKIVKRMNEVLLFVAFSSGSIEIFEIEEEQLNSLCSVELDDELGIGSRLTVHEEDDAVRLHVGTSGSYLMNYRLKGSELVETERRKLGDRSGVTAMSRSDDGAIIVGFDSGRVESWVNGQMKEVHSHLSTVVGIVEHDGIVHSTSLDCAIVSTKDNERTHQRRSTIVNIPAALSLIRNCLIVAGDDVETFEL